MSKPTLLSIVCPIHNEAESIPELYSRLKITLEKMPFDYELVFVNDSSKDNSLPLLLELKQQNDKIKIISLSRNFGHQIALSAGIEHARGDAVVVMDADLQDPPEMIPQFVEKWQEGYEVVYAVRTGRLGEHFLIEAVRKLYYRTHRWMTDLVDVPLDAGDFRLMSRKIIDIMVAMPEKRRYLRGLTCWIGYKQTGIPYIRSKRFAGKSKYSFRRLVTLAWEGITSLSIKPVKMGKSFGVMCCFASLFCIFFMAFSFWVLKRTDWLFNIFVCALFLMVNGVQLIFLGVLGEYIGRTSEEVRNRPLYLIEKIF